MERLPSYRELKSSLPASNSQLEFVQLSRQTVNNILNGVDPRLLLIVGPCSIHDLASAKEYAALLKELSTQLVDQFFVLMRVYFEKPRTIAGWKGFLYDPFLDGSNQIQAGIEFSRQLLLDLTESEIAAATEFLDPLTAFYYDDLVTWGSIGARTSSSQTHRQLASSLPMPIGIKNGIAGNVSAAVDGVVSASQTHTFLGLNEEGLKAVVKTKGNQAAHVVLRGGEGGPNYDPDSVIEALKKLERSNLPKRLIIDCSHHNSNKQFSRQVTAFQTVLQQIIQGNQHIRGLMLESHLFAGSQPLSTEPNQLKYGVSVTDPCLDWQTTRHLLLWGAHHFSKYREVDAANYQNHPKVVPLMAG